MVEILCGIGNYVDCKLVDGGGICWVFYMIDLMFNDYIMDDIFNIMVFYLFGEVWVIVVWDLYWVMVDLYGFDEDIINGIGGNNMVI